ncbi:MAG: glycosyltransferase family 2 protein [Anaerolineales bacterium]|nr:glycosyltransferase family 2 protein [Anaerolineales bacterium]
MSSPLVSIGIVTWNSAALLPACLDSIARQRDAQWELIVVDNASADNSADLAAQLSPAATVIRNTENTGFCAAHNQAIRASKGAYYLPLNPDVNLAPDYLSGLVSALEERPAYGSAAGKLLQPAETGQLPRFDSTGLFMDRQRHQYLRGHGDVDDGRFDRAEEVFGVDGAAPLYRRAMLEDVRIAGQYFDESFFIHKEDVDLAWRARLLGWRCWYAPEAAAVHARTFRPSKRDAVPPKLRLHAVKNRYLLIFKNESPQGWRRDFLRILWYDLKIIGYLCLFEHSSLAALNLVRKALPRIRFWRREIRKRTRVKPGELLAWFT